MKSKTKKLVALLMAAAMMLSVAACSNDEGGSNSGSNSGSSAGTNDTNQESSTGDNGSSEASGALSEEEYKAKVQEIGEKITELSSDVTSLESQASTDHQGAIDGLTEIINEMRPLYDELANLKAPEKYADAQAKIKEGSSASVEMLDRSFGGLNPFGCGCPSQTEETKAGRKLCLFVSCPAQENLTNTAKYGTV